MKNSVTIKDMAFILNVSVSTVSKALNNKVDVSKNTKKRIQKLAKNHNYIPNDSAIALRKRRTKIIAVVMPQINSTFYCDILSEIQMAATKRSYKILLMQSFKSEKRELECINDVMGGCVDGILVLKMSQKSHVSIIETTSRNKMKFPMNLIYLDDKSPMTNYDIKSLANKSFNKLLKQIN